MWQESDDNPLLKPLAFLCNVNSQAYKSKYLTVNDVLTRNPYGSSFLRNCVLGIDARRVSVAEQIITLCIYYVRASIHFLLYFFSWCVFKFSRFRCISASPPSQHELFALDTFLLLEQVAEAGEFQERFLPGLSSRFKARAQPYVFIPRLHGRIQPVGILRVIKALRRSGEPVLLEFELLSFSDILRLLHFLLIYPMHVLLLQCWREEGVLGEHFYRALVETLNGAEFLRYVRYIVGVNLAARLPQCKRVISWCENQAIEKPLYRGLHDSSVSIPIWGCQFFLKSDGDCNLFVAEDESKYGVCPDVVLTNGPVYLEESDIIEYREGVSLRYGELFHENVYSCSRDGKVLVLLSYYLEVSECILAMALAAGTLCQAKVRVKPHPVRRAELLLQSLPHGWDVPSGTTHELLAETAIVIGAGSGSLLEAAACGVSVIVVDDGSVYSTNPMPEYGRGEIWEIAHSPVELEQAYSRLLNMRQVVPERILALAETIRSAYFVEPTDEAIDRAFCLGEHSDST